MVLKCKMCGGDLNIEEGMTVCECEYCNTKQTVPAVDDEKKIKLFERANRFRMECQFDKAASVYESIIEEFETEAEGYWGNLLCKYGIEYVDDPATGDKVPTCHRSSFDSFMDDKDFESVMDYADSISRSVYREQAKQIEEIRKGIIEVSGREEPYDIFICYKETAEDGQRTLDSVLAQDIYEALTDKGYRVFFSRITLEDKLGTEYEPYIFAALNSAKVMLAFGTTYDYYNAVWVKNEWSRYLKLMAKDKTKHLIPCYKDIDAYDIPKEFAKLQAQDLGKVGATQDLLRGIEKIIGSKKKDVVKETVVVQSGNSTNVDAMLKRGQIAIEDKDWTNADKFFEEALNQNPECAEAYLGKLLVENKVGSLDAYFSKLEDKYSSATEEKLTACDEEIEHINAVVKENVLEGYLDAETIMGLYAFDRTYSSSLACRKEQKKQQQTELESDKLLFRVRQYLKGEKKAQIEAGLEKLTLIHDERIAKEQEKDNASVADVASRFQARITRADREVGDLRVAADREKLKYYESLVAIMNSEAMVSIYESTMSKFLALGNYKDSAENAKKCQAKIEKTKKELREKKTKEIERKNKFEKYSLLVEELNNATTISEYDQVRKKFEAFGDYEDSVEYAKKCQSEIDRLNEEAKDKERRAKITKISISVLVVICVVIVMIMTVIIPSVKYKHAVELKNNGQYSEALTVFESIVGYKDSNEQILSIKSSVEYISTISVGESFYYGNYNDEPLEWTILDIQGDQVMAITTNAVDERPYNNKHIDVTWSSCSLRTWLNGEFINEAFSSEEQSRIKTTTVSPGNNPKSSTDAGNTTEDRIFLLSIDEVNQYFSSKDSRVCDYNGNACLWWLRSPGYFQDYASNVDIYGSVGWFGNYVNVVDRAVRPALWISLES